MTLWFLISAWCGKRTRYRGSRKPPSFWRQWCHISKKKSTVSETIYQGLRKTNKLCLYQSRCKLFGLFFFLMSHSFYVFTYCLWLFPTDDFEFYTLNGGLHHLWLGLQPGSQLPHCSKMAVIPRTFLIFDLCLQLCFQTKIELSIFNLSLLSLSEMEADETSSLPVMRSQQGGETQNSKPAFIVLLLHTPDRTTSVGEDTQLLVISNK